MVVPRTLLDKLRGLQVKESNRFYEAGMFPSQRKHPYFPYCREDSNIFYTALIAFTLLPLLDRLPEEDRLLLAGIVAGIRGNYPRYASLSTPGLYNFYRTNPSDHYPNGNILRRFKHFKLADDTDDTAIINATREQVTDTELKVVRDELVRFSNLASKQIKHPLRKYEKLPAHAVWFGSGVMPVEFDLCVMANILYFTFQQGSELNETDRASLDFIRRAVLDGDVVNHPFLVSYYYPDPSVIFYHLARLATVMELPEEYLPVKEIVAGLQVQLTQATSLVERLLLSTALLKLGQQPNPVDYTMDELEASFTSFSFFIAPMLAGTRSRIMNYLAEFAVFQVEYVCEAYYYALALEYELLGQK
ncbi:MAG: hypothetical protein ACJAZ9_000980 [Neolewinella sp.]|jgi:hypothetical protein